MTAEDVRQLFGEKLRAIRLAKQMSQEELAFRSGLHPTYVSSVERGKRNISLVNIKKLADALDVPLRVLMPDEQDEHDG